jgi:hypothetical protein
VRTIREYPVFRNVLTMMPIGAEILGVHSKGARNETISVLALIDTTAALVTRRMVIISSDKPIPSEVNPSTYIGTAYRVNGGLDFHVCDLGEELEGSIARDGEAERLFREIAARRSGDYAHAVRAAGELNAFHFPREEDCQEKRR